MSQLESVNLHLIKDAVTNPVGHTPIFNYNDSINMERDTRAPGGELLHWNIPRRLYVTQPTTGNLGATGGMVATTIAPTGTTRNDIEQGDGDPGDVLGGPRLTGLSETISRSPLHTYVLEFTSGWENPQFGRLIDLLITSGTTFQNAAGQAGASFVGVDPVVQGHRLQPFLLLLTNTNAATWGNELAIAHRSGAFGSSDYDTAEVIGYGAAAEYAANELGLKLFKRSTGVAITAPGSNAQIRVTASDDADRSGRQTYFAAVGLIDLDVPNGCSFWHLGRGGFRTTAHMPPVVGGVSNTESKYSDAMVRQLLGQIEHGGTVVSRVCLGENSVPGGPFAEGTGTDLGAYRGNMESILDRIRANNAAAGASGPILFVSTHNTVLTDRMLVMAEILQDIARSNPTDVAFFDRRGALIDAGLTGANDLLQSQYRLDAVHQSQLGMSEFARLEWAAISSAEAPPALPSSAKSGMLTTAFPKSTRF